MTRCSGLKKDLCKEPCTWINGKGCKKPDSVAQAEKEAKLAAKLAKKAAIQAEKENALAIKAAEKASKAVKAVKEAKVREIKAIKAVKEAKEDAKEKVVKKTSAVKEAKVREIKAIKDVKEAKLTPAKEKVVKTKDKEEKENGVSKTKFSWDKKEKFVFEKHLPFDFSTVKSGLYDGAPIQKIKDHSKAIIINMLGKKMNIREIYPNMYYVPSKDIFIAIVRKQSSKEPEAKNNNDYIGFQFKYAKDVKYKLFLNKKQIVLIENITGKFDEKSNEPLKAIKLIYKDVVPVFKF